ncbi:hypothetical protein BX600DRAFT_458142 [Xylariales sp. PMI_506]|nr:hypothetical protein BX600DRAFT_458142 [Xylariales sp. PMI_506]
MGPFTSVCGRFMSIMVLFSPGATPLPRKVDQHFRNAIVYRSPSHWRDWLLFAGLAKQARTPPCEVGKLCGSIPATPCRYFPEAQWCGPSLRVVSAYVPPPWFVYMICFARIFRRLMGFVSMSTWSRKRCRPSP